MNKSVELSAGRWWLLPELWRLYWRQRYFRVSVVAGLLFSLVVLLHGPFTTPDSVSNFTAWENLKNGELDLWRTPVYPLFVGLLNDAFGLTGACWAVVVLQLMLMLVTFPYYYSLSSRFLGNGAINFAVALFYIASPFVMGTNGNVLNEGPSVVGVVLLFYMLFRVWDLGCSLRRFLSLTALLMLLVFFRPALLILFPTIYIMCVLLAVRRRFATASLVAATTLLPLGAQLMYAAAFQRQFGLFATSHVSVVNNYYIQRMSGFYHPEAISNPAIRRDMDVYFSRPIAKEYEVEPAHEYLAMLDAYGLKELSRAVNENMVACGFKENIHGLIERYKVQCGECWFASPEEGVYRTVSSVFAPSLAWLPQLLFVWLVFSGWIMWRRGKVPSLSLVMAAYVAGNIFTSFVGAQYEWSRLCVSSIPLLMILVGEMVRFIRYPDSYIPA